MGATVNRTNIFAFDATTGAISSTFVPTVNGVVTKVLATGDGSSVYIAGAFTTVNGTPRSRVARLNVSNGSIVGSFTAPALNGVVNDMVMQQRRRLYIGGAFKKVGLRQSLQAPAGAWPRSTPPREPTPVSVTAAFTDVFNGGSLTVKAIDVADDGSRLAAVGNFRTVNGQTADADGGLRHQHAAPRRWRRGPRTSTTTRAQPVFDTYMRDVSISPDSESVYVATHRRLRRRCRRRHRL